MIMPIHRRAVLGVHTLTNRGFTLIEIMIAVAILGIVTAIALPNFNEHVRKSGRVDAQMALRKAANDLERIFLQCNSYVELYDPQSQGSNDPCVYSANEIKSRIEQAYKNIPPLPGKQRYELRAQIELYNWELRAVRVPTGPQKNDRCGDLVLRHALVSSPSPQRETDIENSDSGVTPEECWQR